MTAFSDPRLDEKIAELILQKQIATENLTRDQLAEAFKQALASGDFMQVVVVNSDAQAVIYMPYREVEQLRGQIADLKRLLADHNIPIPQPEL